MSSSYTNLSGTNSTLGPLSESLSRKLYPKNVNEILEWASDLWLHEGTYTQTIRKAIRYFMTEIKVTGEDRTVEEGYTDFITSNYDILEEAAKTGDAAVGFGNSFTSIYMPIKRILICPNDKCNTEFPYKQAADYIKFDPSKIGFKGKCPFCKKENVFSHKDLYDTGPDSFPKVIRWDPKMIRIAYNSITSNTSYSMDPSIDTSLSSRIRGGDPFILSDTPWEVIKAVCGNKPVKFNKDNFYHMKFEPPAFLKRHTRGWGIPPFMSDFGTVVMLMLMSKYNEVLLSDYLVPMRVISPAGARAGSSDMHMNASLMGQTDFADTKANIEEMIDEHRTNPSKIHTAPIQLAYQIMGGEAEQLTPIEIMKHYEMKLLNNMGVPSEFVLKSINQSAGPLIGFKLFEKNWQHVSNSLDGWLTWFTNTMGALKKWEPVDVETTPTSIYENDQIQAMKLELANAGQISKTDGYKVLNLDWREQKRKVIEEQKFEMKLQEEAAKEMDTKGVNQEVLSTLPAGAEVMQQAQQAQQAQGGAPPPEGVAPAPMPAGQAGGGMGSDNPTIDQMMSEAEQIAQQLFGMQSTQRRSELINLSKNNEVLHALVSQKLNDLEQQAETQGLAMAREQGGVSPQ